MKLAIFNPGDQDKGSDSESEGVDSGSEGVDSESEGTDNVDSGMSGQQNRTRISDVDEP